MNKFKIGLLFSSALLLGACSDVATEAKEDVNAAQETVESVVVEGVEESIEEKNDEVESVEEVVDNSPNGKRSNPYTIGDVITVGGKQYTDSDTFEYEADVQLSNLIRGQEAYDWAISQNQFNEPAPDGWEWGVLDISVTLNKGSVDEAFKPAVYLYSVKSDGTPSPDGHFMSMGDYDFHYPNIYEGGNVTGKLPVLIPVDDPEATIKMDWNWEGDIFFKITE